MEDVELDLFGEPIEIKTRVCSKCGEEKPLDEFSNDPYYNQGRRRECKKCKNKMSKFTAYIRKNFPIPENYICPICLATEKELRKDQEDYEIQKSVWMVDHDHDIKDEGDIKSFRGYICNRCNIGAGMIKTIKNAERLIEHFKGKNKPVISTLEFQNS